MDVYKVLAWIIPVFILVSCVYRKHILQRRLFFAGIALYIAGLALNDIAGMLYPSPFGIGAALPPTPVAAPIARYVGFGLIYATLPVFFAACWGSATAYPQCSNCGYNLTGNHSGVCPECGKALTPDGSA
jgi:hypothetical protein